MDWIPIIWILAGIVFILLEFVIPGLIIIFLGVGALATGLALLAGLPTNHGIPFLFFSGSTVVSLLLLRKQFAKVFRGASVVNDNGRADSDDDIIGHRAQVLNWPEQSLEGKIELRGSTWNARSEAPLSTGDTVVVVGREGIHLVVSKA